MPVQPRRKLTEQRYKLRGLMTSVYRAHTNPLTTNQTSNSVYIAKLSISILEKLLKSTPLREYIKLQLPVAPKAVDCLRLSFSGGLA